MWIVCCRLYAMCVVDCGVCFSPIVWVLNCVLWVVCLMLHIGTVDCVEYVNRVVVNCVSKLCIVVFVFFVKCVFRLFWIVGCVFSDCMLCVKHFSLYMLWIVCVVDCGVYLWIVWAVSRLLCYRFCVVFFKSCMYDFVLSCELCVVYYNLCVLYLWQWMFLCPWLRSCCI